jgi:exosortase/archaeosortase family protein
MRPMSFPSPVPSALGLGRVAAFLALFVVLAGAYRALGGSALERWVIEVWTVQPAAALLGWIDPAAGVQAAGPRLAAPGGGLNVLRGCEGTDVLLLLAAAMIAAPLPWRWRAAGLVAGIAVVFVLNQARLVTLFYAHRADAGWFDLAHGLLLPLAMVAGAGLFYLAWLRRFGAAA